MTDYQKWILEVVGDVRWEANSKGFMRMVGSKTELQGEPLIQRCDLAAPLMAKAFPELKVIAGSYRSKTTHNWWMFHVWCIESNGNIIDPTGRQFDDWTGDDSYKQGEYRSSN